MQGDWGEKSNVYWDSGRSSTSLIAKPTFGQPLADAATQSIGCPFEDLAGEPRRPSALSWDGEKVLRCTDPLKFVAVDCFFSAARMCSRSANVDTDASRGVTLRNYLRAFIMASSTELWTVKQSYGQESRKASSTVPSPRCPSVIPEDNVSAGSRFIARVIRRPPTPVTILI